MGTKILGTLHEDQSTSYTMTYVAQRYKREILIVFPWQCFPYSFFGLWQTLFKQSDLTDMCIKDRKNHSMPQRYIHFYAFCNMN